MTTNQKNQAEKINKITEREKEEKCENYVSAEDLIVCEDCQELFCLDCLEGGYCRDCSPVF